MKMAFLIACCLSSAFLTKPALRQSEPKARPPENALDVSPGYEAFWLLELKKGDSANYQRLLITRQSLKQLANQKLPLRAHSVRKEGSTPLAFDHSAMTFATYGKDSLWSDPFACVKEFGEYDQETQTIVVDGVKSRVEPCPLGDVVKLLENPLGKQPLHRLSHPLSGAELTTKAFLLLLKEQIAGDGKVK